MITIALGDLRSGLIGDKGEGAVKMTNNPMDQSRVVAQLANIRAAPRCGAKTRAGGACQCPAVRGRRRAASMAG